MITLKSPTPRLPAPLAFTIEETLTFLPDPPNLAPAPKKPGPPDLVLQAAIQFLNAALANGPVKATTLTSDAKDNALSQTTLNRAKSLLNIISVIQVFSGKWFWKLPNDPRPLPENPLDRQLAESLASFNRCATRSANLERGIAQLIELDNLPPKPRKKPKPRDPIPGPPPPKIKPAMASPVPPNRQ